MSAIATELRLLPKKTPVEDAPDESSSTAWFRDVPRATLLAWCVSVSVHTAGLVLCSLVWLLLPQTELGLAQIDSLLAVGNSIDPNDVVEQLELEEVDLALPETPELNLGGQSVAHFTHSISNPADSIAPSGARVTLTATAATSPWAAADVLGDAGPVGSAEGVADLIGAGLGTGYGVGDGSGDSFFGLRPVGRKVAYVLDCSRSMNHPHFTDAKTRFKRMKLELLSSVRAMGPESAFYFVFFNDFPHPMPSRGLVPAAEQPKIQYLHWMQQLKADGNTEPTLALKHALSLQPEILYFLTDGSFTHKVEQELLSLRSGRTEIHTFAFDAPFTPSMRNSYRKLLEDDRFGARECAGGRSDFRKVAEAFASHKFLMEMAHRHGGRFRLIPFDG